MTLRYDFDFYPSPGDGTNATATPAAFFRDRETVEALRGADGEVRNYFIASGFGLHVYDSGYPPGTYPGVDRTARMEVIDRLSANLEIFDLGGKDMNGFDFAAFLTHLGEAQPEAGSLPEAEVIDHPRATERATAVMGVMFLTMIYALVWGGGAILGL